MKFQVRHNAGNILHAVDISAKTCTCRGWQLTGIPCCHVIAALHSRGMTMMDYVDDIYKRDAYRRTYTPSISPITGPQAWPNPGLNPLTPPFYTKKAGRPKKSRRKEAGEQNTSTPTPEAAANATPSTSGNLSRKGLTMRCKKCRSSRAQQEVLQRSSFLLLLICDDCPFSVFLLLEQCVL
ncbi:Uncharacterized protein Adt_36556 [Abeliophyllum distichum]|uniref:SWIM-type domain-containing protein n=1 Tax=Abeliophyllum distichum TaxID=126358 RepID=A0ABD1QHY3_9LAMI